MAAEADGIRQASLRGHGDEVTWLDAAPWHDSLIASASEDGTARLWDVRAAKTKAACLDAFRGQPLSCVAFGRGAGEAEQKRLFVSGGRRVGEFDLRRPDILVPLRRHLEDSAREPVSLLAMHDGGEWLATGDDYGDVRLLGVPAAGGFGECYDVAARKHKTLVGAMTWLPGADSTTLVSGAMDRSLAFWSVQRCRSRHGVRFNCELLHIVGDDAAIVEAGSTELGLFNPPFVQALAASSCGRLLSIALGDGSFAVWQTAKRQQLLRVPAHNTMLSHTAFASWRSCDGDATPLLLTCASGDIKMWRLDGMTTAVKNGDSLKAMAGGPAGGKKKKKRRRRKRKKAAAAAETEAELTAEGSRDDAGEEEGKRELLAGEGEAVAPPAEAVESDSGGGEAVHATAVLRVRHGDDSVNMFTTLPGHDGLLAVADTTSVIALYYGLDR